MRGHSGAGKSTYSTDFCESMEDGDAINERPCKCRQVNITTLVGLTIIPMLTKDRDARNERPRDVGKLTIPTVLVYERWSVYALINRKIFFFHSQIEPFLLDSFLSIT